jgi:hypothetical protein
MKRARSRQTSLFDPAPTPPIAAAQPLPAPLPAVPAPSSPAPDAPPDDPIALWNGTHDPDDQRTLVAGPEAERLAWLCEITNSPTLRLSTSSDGKRYLIWRGDTEPLHEIGAWLAWSVVDLTKPELARFFLAQCTIEDQGEIVREWCQATEEEFDEFLWDTEAAHAQEKREEAMSPEERRAYVAELLA